MFKWRNALILGLTFVAVGVVYFLAQGNDQVVFDRAGLLMLIALGVAMAFGFSVLLRGSREL